MEFVYFSLLACDFLCKLLCGDWGLGCLLGEDRALLAVLIYLQFGVTGL